MLAALAASLCAQPALANSAPGKPSAITSAFTVAVDTPVVVRNEVLTFTVGRKNEKEAAVTADYTMQNPSGKAVTVNMLFPSMGDMTGSAVTVDGEATDAAISHIGFLKSPFPPAEGIIMDINYIISIYNRSKQGVYAPVHFDPDDAVNVYDVSRDAKGTDTVEYPKGATLFEPENHGFSQTGNTVKLDEDKSYRLYLLHGGSLKINGASHAPDTTMTMRQLALLLKKQTLSGVIQPDLLSPQDYLNQCYKRFDDLIENGDVITAMDIEGGGVENFTVLCYQVTFNPGETRDVRVGYSIAAGYPPGYPPVNQQESAFEYLLNPASYWAGFDRLELKVIPGPGRRYLESSTLPLKKGRDGSFSAVFKSLPDKDLYFVLGGAAPNNPALDIGAGIAAGILLALLAVFIGRRVKRRRGG